MRTCLAVIPLALLFALVSCNGDDSGAASVKEKGAITETTEFANNLLSIPSKAGIAGFFNVPEMLCLSVADSAAAAQTAGKVRDAYRLLEAELAATGSVRNGPFGQIIYNNDTNNFRFECFALIRRIPATEPSRARIVVLEANHMLAYNHYGPYQHLYMAYAELSGYCGKNGLRQSGPLREYYMTDPRKEPSEARLRTLLLLPVRRR